MNRLVRVVAVVAVAGISFVSLLLILSNLDSNGTGADVSTATVDILPTLPSQTLKSSGGLFANSMGSLSISSFVPILVIPKVVVLTAIMVIFLIYSNYFQRQSSLDIDIKERQEKTSETEEYSEAKPNGTLIAMVSIVELPLFIFLFVIVHSFRSKLSTVTSHELHDVKDRDPINQTKMTETKVKAEMVEIPEPAKETKAPAVPEDMSTKKRDREIIHGSKESYQMGDTIGSGCVATAYLATRQSDGQLVAVKKTWRKDVLENEALILAQFDHENIVHFVERIGSVNVYEYIDCGVLHDFQQLPVTDAELSAIAAQLLRAIAALQEKRIVHRDIHLENVMVNNDGVIKLIDFDWAVHESKAKVFKERGEHMAPEIYRNEVATCKADVWSVGYCVGRFRGNPRHDIVADKRGYELPNLQAFESSPLLHDFLTHALEMDRRKRWSAQQLLDHDFVRLSAGREHELIKQVIGRKRK